MLLCALNAGSQHLAARAFLEGLSDDPDTVLSELVLVERTCCCGTRRWGAGRSARPRPPRSSTASRIFDVRLALGLVRRGVTRFATRNVAQFVGLGFEEVFDPLAAS